MMVNASIIPPRGVLAPLVQLVASACEADAPVPGAGGRRKFLSRRGAVADLPGPSREGMLDLVGLDDLLIPITRFGNLTTGDVRKLVEAITTVTREWSAPQVRLGGGTALDFPGDRAVWARFASGEEFVTAAARDVIRCVEPLGFFVDRRLFRPMLEVATVTPSTTGPFLQALVDGLQDFRGEEWPLVISLTTSTFVGGVATMTVLHQIQLTS